MMQERIRDAIPSTRPEKLWLCRMREIRFFHLLCVAICAILFRIDFDSLLFFAVRAREEGTNERI